MKQISKIIICLVILIVTDTIVYAQESLVGTWRYVSSSLSSESAGNVKKQNNSDIKFNQKLATNLNKMGFRAGSTLVFNEDGTFVQNVNRKAYSGTYSNSGFKSLTLNFEGGNSVDIDMKLSAPEITFTVPGEKFCVLLNVVENTVNIQTKSYINSLVTQYENNKIDMKFVFVKPPQTAKKISEE